MEENLKSKEYIERSLRYIALLNSYNIVGQLYIDIDAFNDLVAKALYLKKVKLSYRYNVPKSGVQVYQYIHREVPIVLFFEKEDMGVKAIGLTVGPHSTFVDKDTKIFCLGG